jgi:hypothetical protein
VGRFPCIPLWYTGFQFDMREPELFRAFSWFSCPIWRVISHGIPKSIVSSVAFHCRSQGTLVAGVAPTSNCTQGTVIILSVVAQRSVTSCSVPTPPPPPLALIVISAPSAVVALESVIFVPALILSVLALLATLTHSTRYSCPLCHPVNLERCSISF